MPSALVIGGTGFVGRHTVAELHEHGYTVTSLSRNDHDFQFAPDGPIRERTGDRTNPDVVREIERDVDPDVVVDCAAYHPTDVRTAVDVFADVDAYVYVSSGATYAVQEIPKREAETPLHDWSPTAADDASMATYGPRKAECDRIARRAADTDVNAFSVRPTVVYGPQTLQHRQGAHQRETLAEPEPDHDHEHGHDRVYDHDEDEADEQPWTATFPASWAGEDVPGIQAHHDYWIERVASGDSVLVPGDGTAIWHRAYVEDVASAIRIVAERGTPGTAYNVADRRVATLGDVVDLIADALDTTVEKVHANRREFARVGLDPNDFMLYHHPQTTYPHVLSTSRLAALGWESTPLDDAMARTVAESRASGRDGSVHDPGADARTRLIAILSS